jgi:hypothetical protein
MTRLDTLREMRRALRCCGLDTPALDAEIQELENEAAPAPIVAYAPQTRPDVPYEVLTPYQRTGGIGG